MPILKNKIGDTQIAYMRDGTESPFSYIATKFNYSLETERLSGVYQIQIINYYGNHERNFKKMTLDVFRSNRWKEEMYFYSKNVNVE